MANILNLTATEAYDFLMASENFCTTELPEYIDFTPVLKCAEKNIKDIEIAEIAYAAAEQEDVNLCVLSNKDGGYGVRPLTLANPYLYAMIARDMCEDSTWTRIKDCFCKLSCDNIIACAIPQVKNPNKKEPFAKSTQILNWWSMMEQMPIELSMDYRYMFMTDITNCFGEINPQSIDWALSLKGTSDQTDGNHDIANRIIQGLSAMQGGKNIGIPQGSVLFSLIAEIVLVYSDRLLHDAIEAEELKCNYLVLRYVDDYRIFCNDRDKLERISYLLQGILEKLNFRMNVKKTRISDNLVAAAMKPDKAFYIFNTPIFSKKGVDFDGLGKHLYFIYEFGQKFPNSGQLKNMLSDFSKRLKEKIDEADKLKDKVEEGENVNLGGESDEAEYSGIFGKLKVYSAPKHHGVVERIPSLIALCVRIAADNVNVAAYALRVVSQFLAIVDDAEEKKNLIRRVYKSLINTPNSYEQQLWLQNITYGLDDETLTYTAKLCAVVNGDDEPLWNNNWLPDYIQSDLPVKEICDHAKLKDAAHIIDFRERRAYYDDDDSIVIATF